MIDLVTVQPHAKINIVRSRPGSPHVLLAWDFRAIRALDVTTHEIGTEIAYPEDVPEEFVIDEWYVHPSGAWSMALSRDERAFGLRFDHDADAARRVECPATMGDPSGNCWFDDDGSLTIVTYDGLTWRFDGEVWSLAEPSESFTAWSRKVAVALKKPNTYAFSKTDFGGGVTYLRSQSVNNVGIASIPNGEVILVPGDDAIVDMAGYGPSVLVAFADNVLRHRGKTAPQTVYETAPDESIMEIVSHRYEAQESLVILCDAWNQAGARLHVIHAPAPTG